MSTRYLKKVFGNEVALQENLESSEDESSNVQIGKGKQKSFNVFDLLNDNSENEANSSDDFKTEAVEAKEDEEQEDDTEKYDTKSQSKKKRKKHKKKLKNKNNQETKENSDECESDNKDSLDEIDKTVRQINKLLGEPTPSTSQSSGDFQNHELYPVVKSKEKILTVQHKHLNSYNELKRIFGSKTIQNEQIKSKSRGRNGHLKKMRLVPPRDNLLIGNHFKPGIHMTLDKSMPNENNIQYFVYEHSPSYRQIQQKFIHAVESLNPENIISIVNSYPFHVDSLLQSAELCKLSEELAVAANLIERALFYLEYAFHPLFNMTTANCRLDYRKQQNRALFITLFKHLVLVGGKACYRTSLELCKLLLSLDPEEDPLAVVLMIDFYAIKSKEYEWFCEFCNLWENSRNLQQLPNVAYSLALAHFHLGNHESANKYMQDALIMFPGILIPLLEKCSVQADSKVMSHDFFLSAANNSKLPALEKLQTLYVVRSGHLWKEAEILPWLEKQVHIVLDRVDNKEDLVKFCQVKRNHRYKGKLPRNILRHLIVSDLKDVTVNVEEIRDEGSILSHDPLPPLNSIDIYTTPRTVRRPNQNNPNLLSLFFSSIFMDLEGELEGLHVNNQNENDHPEEFD